MRLRRYGVLLKLLCGLLLALLLPMASAWGQTATITAATSQSCAGTRFGGNLGCTANDVTANITFTQPAATRVATCLAGTTLTLDIIATLASGAPDRYDLGIFTGEVGNDPRINDGSKTCSIGLFPISPAPFFAADTDTCGDFRGNSAATLLINSIRVKCVSVAGSNRVALPFVLSWDQNASGNTCNVTNVAPGTTSKCSASTAASIADIITLGHINLTKQTNPDGDTQSFAFTSSTSTVANTPQWTLAGAPTTQALVDNQTKRITVPLSASGGTETLTITEALATFWEPGVTITCIAASGAAANPATVNNATRTITANLTAANFGADCTLTNTKRSKITMVKQVGGRVNVTDQFTLTATGGGTLTDASGTAITAPVTVTTTGTATTAQTTFVSQPGQALTITDTAASGTLPNYVTVYACTNATAGSSTVLPSGSTTTFPLTPAAGDDITCTYTNTPKPRLSLTKVLVGGRAVSTNQFTLNITPGSGSNSFTTTGTGTTVGGGPATLVGTSGVTYTLAEVAASGSLSDYTISYACTNTGTGGTTVTSGTGSSFPIIPVNNDVLACTFTNPRQRSLLTLAKTASVATLPAGGGTVTYTVTITNTDSVSTSLDSLRDTLPSSPANATYVAGTTRFNGIAIADPSISGQTLTWNSTFTIPASASRTLTFDAILPATAGLYTNTVVGFIGAEQIDTTTSTTDNAPATVAVTVPLDPPRLSKTFGTNPVGVGQNSALTFTILNGANDPAQTGLGFTDTLPANVVIATPASVANTCGGSVTATAGTGVITLAGGSLASGTSSCTVTVQMKGNLPGSYLNSTANGNISGLTGGLSATGLAATLDVRGTTLTKAFSPAIMAPGQSSALTFTITNGAGNPAQGGLAFVDTLPAGLTVSGPITTPQCGGTVTSPSSNNIAFSAGTLALNTASCTITVNVTGATIATYVNNTTRISGASSGMDITGVNATLTIQNAAAVTGQVFTDATTGGASGDNDGIRDGSERGLPNVQVAMVDCTTGPNGPVLATALTDGSGQYTLALPSTGLSSGTSLLCIVETNLSAHLSTGASHNAIALGSSGSETYTRATDTIRFPYTSGTNYSGLNFGDVPINTLVPDGQQNALPGTVVFYPHSFTAGSGGTVAFSTSSVPSPAIPGWSQTLYHDTNCNAILDSGEPQLTGPLSVTAGTRVCLIVKEFVPANAPTDAQDMITVSAMFTYANAVPPLTSSLSRTDLTIVAQETLALTKSVNRTTVLPGEILIYTITYSNLSSKPLSNIIIYDTTLAFTTFVSASCGTPLPPTLSGCTVSTQPVVGGTGDLMWTLTGALAPGGSGTVTFQVKVDQ